MCLTLPPKTATTFVYKCYLLINRLDKNREAGTMKVRSPFMGTGYNLSYNKLIRSDRKTAKLTSTESKRRAIDRGLHVFSDLKEATDYARRASSSNGKDIVLCRFTAKSRDLVANGTWNSKAGAVYHRLRFDGVAGVYRRGKPVHFNLYA